MKHFIKLHFGGLLRGFSNANQQGIKNQLINDGAKLFDFFSTQVEINECFSIPASLSTGNLVTLSEPLYVYIFVILYLIHLNKLIITELDKRFGNDWKTKNIGHVVSVEKKLLNDIFGSKEGLRKLFIASGFLSNECRRARILTQGEGCLPTIEQNMCDLRFKIKSYFAIAQIHQAHIQVTLHQVVKTLSPGENEATVILKDEVINTEDVYDILYKSIWNQLLCHSQINYCRSHKVQDHEIHDFCSSRNYNHIRSKIKPFVIEMVIVIQQSYLLYSKKN